MPNTIIPIKSPFKNPVTRYMANLRSINSRHTMRWQLTILARILLQDKDADPVDYPWEQLTYEQTNLLTPLLLSQGRAPATVNLMMAALKGVLKECWRMGLMDTDTYHHAVDIKSIRFTRIPSGRELSFAEIVALVDACKRDSNLPGLRDLAIIAVLRSGLRRSEVAALAAENFERDTGKLVIEAAKGNKDRTIYLSGNILTHVIRWHNQLPDNIGPLFPPISKSGKVLERFMSPQAIYYIVFERAVQADIDSFSPHDFRRTFAGDMLDSGVDIVTVQKMMGHSDPKTTARYDRRGERAKKSASKLLDFPE